MSVLANHQVIDTVDVDEARAVGSRVFRNHQLAPESGNGFRAVLRSAAVGGMTLTYVDYRVGVRIAASEPSSGFLVHIPLTGHADITCGREAVSSDPANAVVVDPAERLDMTWSRGTPQLIIGIDRERMEDHLRRTLNRSLDRPLRFGLGMDLTSAAARAWLDVVHLLLREVSTTDHAPLAMEHLEGLLFQRFLLAQPSTYSGALGDERSVAPRAIQRAMKLIEHHAAEPLTVEDIAEADPNTVSVTEAATRWLSCTPGGSPCNTASGSVRRRPRRCGADVRCADKRRVRWIAKPVQST
ncbi:hypothetical protein LWC34_39620 [Kibdelosporangium philippinense]|uniref:Transcription regulator HTH AraC- type ligand binding domain-containing protein n=1 Tax=Kibdelosporangium philippinense TaxID=211113 RepID=A0ABS8ZNU2_9PSEU|nr:hypothetical protein [Kibdelosporangium philippinense]MCE7008878.1 hypothetical protein [Kibdelosporangium philippinense]